MATRQGHTWAKVPVASAQDSPQPVNVDSTDGVANVRTASTARFAPVITKGLQVIGRAATAGSSRRMRAEQRRADKRLEKKRRALGWGIVSVAAELCVTVGVFFALFAFWQLAWTDVQAERIQSAAVRELEKSPTWHKAAPKVVAVRHTDAPPAEKRAGSGDVVGRLHIPRFGLDYDRLIVEGVDKATVLDHVGIGHYPATQLPGQLGNFAIAGHRATFSRPFNKVPQFRQGDAIVVETADVWYIYTMQRHELVLPSQGNVLFPNPGGSLGDAPTDRYVTITTCHPEWGSKERWIVHGTLAYWMYKSEGTPPELTAQPS